MARLTGRSGLITAAASGMGRAGALLFAREGASVAVVDRDEDAAGRVVEDVLRSGGKAMSISGDLTDDAFARDAVERTATQFGSLDFVWNHAGHPGPAAFENVDMELFALTMNLNVRAAVVVAGAALPHFRRGGGGSIVFTASGSGLVASPFSPIYSAAKFGVVGLTRALAKRYGKENIRCNAVCPGAIDTPMLREFQKRPDAPKTDTDVEAVIKQFGSVNPMGRNGRPEEVAAAALFLISHEASYVNGAILAVDGGMTA